MHIAGQRWTNAISQGDPATALSAVKILLKPVYFSFELLRLTLAKLTLDKPNSKGRYQQPH